ncbi:MAG TPA: branched-chain amino acid ABC transporter permease [Limnochordales bacterium]
MLGSLLIGVSYGWVLFLVAVGLSVIFGLMGFVNLASGSFYILGAYVAISVARATGSFAAALAAGGAATAVLGVAMEKAFLKRLHGKLLEQVLLTLGIAYVVQDMARWLWGAQPMALPPPPGLDGSVTVAGLTLPAYRLALVAVGTVLGCAAWALLERTRLGAYVRAGVDDLETLKSLGVNTSAVFTAVFALGAFLSGLGGALGAVVTGVAPGMDFEMLILALVVVVFGGLGSVAGAIAGSLVLGVVDSLVKELWPQAALFVVYGLMALVLVVRPQGLLGRSFR